MSEPSYQFKFESAVDLNNLKAFEPQKVSLRSLIDALKADTDNWDLSAIMVTNVDTGERLSLADMDKIFNN